MNREIKFQFMLSDGSQVAKQVYSLDDLIDFSFEALSLLNVLATRQFTGLLDNNGKEIYDGDIVKFFDECFPEEFSIGKIKWGGSDYPAYDIYVPSTKQNMEFENFCEDYNSLAGDAFCIEVIGNIYENPELIKTKENQ